MGTYVNINFYKITSKSWVRNILWKALYIRQICDWFRHRGLLERSMSSDLEHLGTSEKPERGEEWRRLFLTLSVWDRMKI